MDAFIHETKDLAAFPLKPSNRNKQNGGETRDTNPNVRFVEDHVPIIVGRRTGLDDGKGEKWH